MKKVFLGMSIQALITSLLSFVGPIVLAPGQQLFAAGIFMILFLVLKFKEGGKTIHISEHLIDSDADPFIPEGFSLHEHKKGGIWKWNPFIFLYLSEDQQRGIYVVGYDLYDKELAAKGVLNANILDYLLKHQELIPENWKSHVIYFWGTIYRDSVDDELCVRCLHWNDSRFFSGYTPLRNKFGNHSSAALAI